MIRILYEYLIFIRIMKFVFTVLLAVLFSLFLPLSADASGGISWNHQIILDKIVYLNGEKVPITILGDGNRSIFVEVSDITNGVSSVVFSEQTSLKNELAEFEFTPDYNSDSYRYKVDVYDITPDNGERQLKNSVYFFTRQNAENIVISEFTTEKDSILPSEGFSFGMRVEDGLGKSIDFVNPSVRMYYLTSSGEESRDTFEITYDESSQKYFGWMEIPKDFEFSGVAQMKATIRGPENLKEITSNTLIKEIEIIDTGVKQLCNENDEGCTQTKEIIVKNIHFLKDEIYPNELVFYEAEITDQDGNPLALHITGRVDYQAPWGPSNFSPVGTYDLTKKRFIGEMTVPYEIIPGEHTMKLDVHGEQYGSLPFSGPSEIKFSILEKPGQIDTLFSSDSPSGSKFYFMGEPQVIRGTIVSGHYYSPPLSNHPVSILVYGDPRNGDKVLLESIQTSSDENGMFREELTLDDRNICDYEVVLQSEYKGFEQTQEINFRMTNTKTFDVLWQDENIPVTVDSSCSIPLSMDFDQPNKKMVVEADTDDEQKFFTIEFPYRLLNGELAVLVNGETNDYVSIHKQHDGYSIKIRADSAHTTVEVIGTTAIPEFETIVMMILAASIIPIILTRNKLILR